jgi:hypothetical protein
MWVLGIDLFWMPGPAIQAARRQTQKEKCATRVVVYPAERGEVTLRVLETIPYVPPAPRDVTALTKEVFG